MIEILVNTPIYVWPLLAFLIWGGLKSKKNHVVSWQALLLMPTIMCAWSIYATVTHYGSSLIFLWAISIAIGIWLGILTIRKLKVKFDKEHNLIEMEGSWTPMVLSLSIFSLRYLLVATSEVYPDLNGSHILLLFENLATIVSGMFIGRLWGYWKQYKFAPHINLVKANT